jgi:1-pyrroline-5-carboxylate dehydrogenase
MTTQAFAPSIPLLSPEGGYANEPAIDFKNPENSGKMQSALDQVASLLGREYDLVIGGQRVHTEKKIRSINPARPAQVIGLHQSAGAEHVEAAMNAALAAFDQWSRTTPEIRASLLLNVARIIRKRYFEFCAWLVYEAGKNWGEAAADASEALDFLDFYAREALRLANATPPIQFPGERCELFYIPLGVGAVISPWNFPFAIMAGMTAAAIVTGNTVILKPSSDAPTIAAKFFEVLEEAGMPAGVVNFCPGSGAHFGNAIVEHPKTRFVTFTGSKDVGLEILEKAARTQPGQIWIKRTILEMGGKNAILVCADADLDKAVEGVVASAFGYSGQKCSACSRAILEAPVYEEFTKRLNEKVAQLTWGDPATNPSLGPVINEAARRSIMAYIKTGKTEGRLIAGGSAPQSADGGYFVEPTVFADVPPDAVIAQEEIFGPVLALIKAANFEEGLKIANQTAYGLTGSIYSTDREKLNRARRDFHVGNLYFNRKSTGAMVGAHPFGGFNMSGTDSKTGSNDYLLLYTQAKSVAEKL